MFEVLRGGGGVIKAVQVLIILLCGTILLKVPVSTATPRCFTSFGQSMVRCAEALSVNGI
jgi:hypothetical protein